jgi:hypothetical protein
MPPTDSPTRALPTLHEFFAPGGILARSSLPKPSSAPSPNAAI